MESGAVPVPPVLVMPLHDPEGVVFPHLEAVTPALKGIFCRAYISITHQTCERYPQRVLRLQADDFYAVTFARKGAPVGAQFLHLYTRAAMASPSRQVLHLCFIDRVAFALQSAHRDRFIRDVRAVSEGDTPLLYQRSARAWATHPENYYEIEHMATRAAELLLGKTLDLTWCHLAVQARQLQRVLPAVGNEDLSMLAEIALGLRDEIRTVDVDWLAWEDPFIHARDACALKRVREKSLGEVQKRLGYVIPTLQLLYQVAIE